MMEEKPAHLGISYAKQFQDRGIAEAYHYRPPYPEDAFRVLNDLISDHPRVVLDVGCGTGDLARGLARYMERIDAIDFSEAMLAQGKRQVGGDQNNIHWLHGKVENTPLKPPYALITAGESLHWMAWEVVCPLFQKMLTPQGYLAILERRERKEEWSDTFTEIIKRYSTNQEYRPYDLVEELEQRQLFQTCGKCFTTATPFKQTIEDFIESMHSRNGFSRERMGKIEAQKFDDEVKDLLLPFADNGTIMLHRIGEIVWGKPLGG